MAEGSCLCGAVRFRVTGGFGPVRLCHCRRCRKTTGSAFSANLRVENEAFELLAGGERVREYRSGPSVRGFCARCGSPVWARIDPDPGAVRVRLGSFDAPEGAHVVAHVWTGSKAPWFEIEDDLPCETEGPSVL